MDTADISKAGGKISAPANVSETLQTETPIDFVGHAATAKHFITKQQSKGKNQRAVLQLSGGMSEKSPVLRLRSLEAMLSAHGLIFAKQLVRCGRLMVKSVDRENNRKKSN